MLSILLLGPTKITLDSSGDTAPLSFRTNKVQALLCYLAVEALRQPGLGFRREALMALLWPDMPLKPAQDNLRQTLYQLRKAVPTTGSHGLILSDRLTIQMHPAADYELDVAQFQNLLQEKPDQLALEKAAALYRGDFLANFFLSDSDDFEAWAADWRLELRTQVLAAINKLTSTLIKQGQYEKAESYARQQLDIDNLRESAHRQLMTALANNGRRAEALQQYQTCRQILREELQVEPSAETTALNEKIRSGEDEKTRSHPPPIPTAFLQRLHNLPAPTTSFVGRQQELAEIISQLSDPTCRLLTLLGPGGIGKTRLALQVASTLTQFDLPIFPDGIFLVSLAAVPTMDHLVPAIADAVNFSFSGNRDPQQQLLAYLKPKKLLLILDNLEHLAAESALLVDFLTAVPGLTFLTTSRIRLNLYEEWHFELTGLALPLEQETANLANHTALQLFVQRARQVGRTDFDESQLAIIAQICYFLAGLPLGIELAAGWLRSHTLSQIAAEIEQNLAFLSTNIKNVPQRHRSLQVAFDHSWRLLPTQSQPTLARLTVFRDGFDHKAAEFVSDATQTTLLNLVDHSILHLSDGRFQIHELIRQFSAEKLSSDDNAETRKRHANYFATFLESQEPCRWTVTEPAALDEISLELKNIQAGWHWAVSQSQNPPQTNLGSNLIARYSTMLAYFYNQRSRYHEGTNLFQQAATTLIDAITERQSPSLLFALAKVRLAEAEMRFHLSQFTEAEKLLKDCLSTFREQDRQLETAVTLVQLGMTFNRLGKYDEALPLLQESLDLFQRNGARVASAEALNALGIIAVSQERFEDGQQLLDQCLTIYKETGYQRGIARALNNMATGSVRSGDHITSLPLYKEALVAVRAINDRMSIAVILCNIGGTFCILGNYEESLRYYEESLPMFQEMGERRWIAVSLNGIGENLLDSGQVETAEKRFRQSLEISTAIQSLPDSLDSLAYLGEISAFHGKLETAVMILTYVTNQTITKPQARTRAKLVLAQLNDRLAPDSWQEATKLAQTINHEQVIEHFTISVDRSTL